MDKISTLLQQLADKLGTTVNYLWRVMVKEAFVNGIGNIIIYAIVIALFFLLLKLHLKLMRKQGDFIYDEFESMIPVMIIAFVAWLIVFIICIFSMNDTLNSFLNPEYWALHQVLNKL